MLEGLMRFLGYKKASPPTISPSRWMNATAVEEQYMLPTRDTYDSQLELYEKLTWVQIAISAVAKIAASTALEVVRLEGEKTVAVPNHPFEMLLQSPNPLFSRFELLQATISYLCLTGNAYWWLNRAGPDAPIDEIWVLPGHRMNPVPDGNLFLRGYMYTTDQIEEPLEPWEVCHFRLFNPSNSFVGLSPIQSLTTIAAGDLAMTRYNTSYFDKNNAKMPGALAFSDPIDDDTWSQMKKEVAAEYGGTRRRLMLLRNTGVGGVNWIPMAMTQSDMQFLEGRRANKEEIFALFAPGLSSVLDVNATEANSTAGRATFIELGVWPLLSLMGEKITNDVLRSVETDTIARFEDIRATDKLLEIQEIDAFSKVHTVDEVRVRWYNTDPLGDDRGRLLVSELTKGFTVLPPDLQQKEDERKEREMQALEAQLQMSAQNPTEDSGEEPPGTADRLEEPDSDAVGRREEVKALKRWLRNRPGKSPLGFKARYLDAKEILAISQAQEVSDAADARFPFYP